MKALLVILLWLTPVFSWAGDYTVFYQNSITDFDWNQIIPLDQYKPYTFTSHGLGVEKEVFNEKGTHLALTGNFQVGNYATLVGGGGTFRPDFFIGKVAISPEFNLGFEYLQTNSSSPHQVSEINLYSKIGPRISYDRYGVGIYHYYSSLFGNTSLNGWSFAVLYNF